MTNRTFKTIHSVGIKTNRQVGIASTGRKVKSRPTASRLKALGYTASQREAILASYSEL